MKAYKIRYNLPGSTGHQEIVLAQNENMALINLEAKDPRFKNKANNSYYKVLELKEISFQQVKTSQLSVSELLSVLKAELK